MAENVSRPGHRIGNYETPKSRNVLWCLAGIPDSVVIAVFLSRVEIVRTIVARGPHAVRIRIGLIAITGHRAIVVAVSSTTACTRIICAVAVVLKHTISVQVVIAEITDTITI